MNEPVLHQDFRDLLFELIEGNVRFVVVGAHALAVHGVPRATGDLDLLIVPEPENAQRAFEALVEFGAPVEIHGVTAADFEIAGTVYQLGVPPRRIDLLTAISGVDWEEAERTAIRVSIDGMELPVLARGQLLANKLAAGRAKDLVDADLLREKE